jgi:arsenate reductase
VERFLGGEFDYVITVCDDANETCPVFTGKVARRLHRGFSDPSFVTGTEAHRREAFRGARDKIRAWFDGFYRTELLPQLNTQ